MDVTPSTKLSPLWLEPKPATSSTSGLAFRRGTRTANRTLDVIMLYVTGGRERTASQFRELVERSDFRHGDVIQTAGPLRIVEATAV